MAVCERCGRPVGSSDGECWQARPSVYAVKECREVAAAREAGRQEERARVVSVLRAGVPCIEGDAIYGPYEDALEIAASFVEAGEHMKPMKWEEGGVLLKVAKS